MSRNIAFLFPGQGAHFVGMLDALRRRDASVIKNLLEEANEVLKMDLGRIIDNGPPEKLNETRITQPALLLTSYAHWLVHGQELASSSRLNVFLGHSVGEFSALVAASAISFADVLRLVEQRGFLMETCRPKDSEDRAMGMVAVVPVDGIAAFQTAIETDEKVDVAGFNSRSQITLSGPVDVLQAYCEELRLRGLIRRSRLLPNVTQAFHSRWMATARSKFTSLLNKVEWKASNEIFISNASGKPVDNSSELPKLLSIQLTQPVLWMQSVDWCLKNHPDIFFCELGPGKILSKLINRDHPTAQFIEL